MLILFIDLRGSTEAIASYTSRVVAPAVEAQLVEIEAELRKIDAEIWVGPHQGDGTLCVLHAQYTSRVVDRCLDLQRLWSTMPSGLPVRFALGTGDAFWLEKTAQRTAWTKEGIPAGVVVNFTYRLLSVCLPGGVVINDGVQVRLLEYGHLLQSFKHRMGRLKGFRGEQSYWIAEPTVPEDDAEAEKPVTDRSLAASYHAEPKVPESVAEAVVLKGGHRVASVFRSLYGFTIVLLIIAAAHLWSETRRLDSLSQARAERLRVLEVQMEEWRTRFAVFEGKLDDVREKLYTLNAQGRR